jgi:hypothetical protein
MSRATLVGLPADRIVGAVPMCEAAEKLAKERYLLIGCSLLFSVCFSVSACPGSRPVEAKIGFDFLASVFLANSGRDETSVADSRKNFRCMIKAAVFGSVGRFHL